MRLEWEAARDAEPMDAWATITLIVVSVALSVQEFRGSDFAMLHLDYRALPQEPWRFLSASVLHGGYLHLAMNVIWLLQLGAVVEALLGIWTFAGLVSVLAAASSASQWAVSGRCVGLSGIVYGLFGLLWALDRWPPACRGVMNKRTTDLFLAWFLVCVMLTWLNVMPIGNTAHGVGALLGGAVGWALAARGGARVLRLGAPLGALALVALGQVPAVRHVVNRSEAYDYELFQRGLDMIEAEDYEGAIAIYEELVERAPEFEEARNNLAYAYQELARWREER